MNKKGNAVAIIAIVLAFIILIMFLVNIGGRECKNNRDCTENSYCGTDYECHQFPSQVVVKESSYIPAAIIIGVALIVAAWIFRGKSFKLSGS